MVAEAGDGAEAIELGVRADIDLAVLDVAMPKFTGLQAAAELARRRPELKLLMLSMHDSEQFLFEALKAAHPGSCSSPVRIATWSTRAAPRCAGRRSCTPRQSAG